MHTYRFTQPAGIDVGGAGEEQDPEQADAAQLQGEEFFGQRPDRREVTDERQAGEQADGQPQGVFGRAPGQLVYTPGRGIELDALVAIPFGDFLAPHEDPRPRALWAGVTAPDPPGKYRDGEQAEGADDQQRRQENEVLRPEGCTENVELAVSQVP
ncbi:hypothetical protein D3C79_676070 [compost metagenome]